MRYCLCSCKNLGSTMFMFAESRHFLTNVFFSYLSKLNISFLTSTVRKAITYLFAVPHTVMHLQQHDSRQWPLLWHFNKSVEKGGYCQVVVVWRLEEIIVAKHVWIQPIEWVQRDHRLWQALARNVGQSNWWV